LTPTHIVATPGRLIDLIQRKVINLKETKFLVLDEADEMVTILKKVWMKLLLNATQNIIIFGYAGNHKAINPKLPE
jgi:ATP-dependent RNA helicase DeaD